MARRRRLVKAPLIPPSTEQTAAAALVREQERRADSCLRIVKAALKEYRCEAVMSRLEYSDGRPALWFLDIRALPAGAPDKLPNPSPADGPPRV